LWISTAVPINKHIYIRLGGQTEESVLLFLMVADASVFLQHPSSARPRFYPQRSLRLCGILASALLFTLSRSFAEEPIATPVLSIACALFACLPGVASRAFSFSGLSANPFRIRTYAKTFSKSFRIRTYKKSEGCNRVMLTAGVDLRSPALPGSANLPIGEPECASQLMAFPVLAACVRFNSGVCSCLT